MPGLQKRHQQYLTPCNLSRNSGTRPAILPFLSWAYGSPSRVLLRGAPHDSSPVLSISGVKQGDPLNLLLFAFTLEGHLQRVATAHPAAQIVTYFDDITVVGPAAVAAYAFEALSMEVRTVGLTRKGKGSSSRDMEWRWNEISSKGVHMQCQLHGGYSQTQEAGDGEAERKNPGYRGGKLCR
jgi:hypothetical protein